MLCTTYALIVIVAFPAVVAAQQVPPPGFEVVDITRDPDVLNRPSDLNNCGQAVFYARSTPSWASAEVFLYDNGLVTRITENQDRDVIAGITQDGMIYWLRGIGNDGVSQLMTLAGGEEIELARDRRGISSAAMNAGGHYAWVFDTDGGCNGTDTAVAFFDGKGTTVFSEEGSSLQSIELNERDELVWNEYLFCEDPQRVDVVLYQDGVFTRVNGQGHLAFWPVINDRTQVAYTSQNEEVSETRVWEEGVSRRIVEPSQTAPQINNLGDVTFARIYPEGGEYSQVWDERLPGSVDFQRRVQPQLAGASAPPRSHRRLGV